MLFIVMVVNYQVSNTRKINPDETNGIWTTETCAVFDTSLSRYVVIYRRLVTSHHLSISPMSSTADLSS